MLVYICVWITSIVWPKQTTHIHHNSWYNIEQYCMWLLLGAGSLKYAAIVMLSTSSVWLLYGCWLWYTRAMWLIPILYSYSCILSERPQDWLHKVLLSNKVIMSSNHVCVHVYSSDYTQFQTLYFTMHIITICLVVNIYIPFHTGMV